MASNRLVSQITCFQIFEIIKDYLVIFDSTELLRISLECLVKHLFISLISIELVLLFVNIFECMDSINKYTSTIFFNRKLIFF